MTAQPANNLFHALKKIERDASFSLHRKVTEEDMDRTRALFPELMADLRRRRNNPLPKIDRGEWDYDGDLGREHADNDDDQRRRS